MAAPYYRWCIDAIGREQCEDVALLPFPDGFEAFAEVNRCAFNLFVGVRSIGFGIAVYYYKESVQV